MTHKCELCNKEASSKIVWNEYQPCQTSSKLVCHDCEKTFKPDTYFQIQSLEQEQEETKCMVYKSLSYMMT